MWSLFFVRFPDLRVKLLARQEPRQERLHPRVERTSRVTDAKAVLFLGINSGRAC